MTAVELALGASTPQEFLDALALRRGSPTLLQIRQLTRRLAAFGAPTTSLRTAVLRTYTTELLRPYWAFEALLHGLSLEVYEAPYGSIVQEARAASALAEHDPEITYLMLRWQDLHPELALPLMRLSAERRREVLAAAVDRVLSMLGMLRVAVRGLIVVTLLPRMHGGELGHFGTMVADSDEHLMADAKARLAARIREEAPSVAYLDLDQIALEIGRTNLFDSRMWYGSRFPFSETGAATVVKHLMRYGVVLKTPRAKCIVLDCDNTLWGGIIGEDGMNGIALGPDYPGSAFVAFQHRLLEFQQRGMLLALCSKNDPDAVLEVLRQHPHQVLREEHIAAMQVNWRPKSENLRALATELNLGLDSFIFVDDSPHECLMVRQQCGGVSVVQVPERLDELPACLDEQPRLEILSLTAEDRERTTMYAQERQRRALAETATDVDRYLESLNMEMHLAIDDTHHIARIAQLTQKTNQFNLTTRRYSEDDVRAFMDDPSTMVGHFSLRDIFGDSGIVGVAIVHDVTAPEARIDALLMSCRVIGRRAESAFLAQMLELLRARGVSSVRAAYVPTPKNHIVRDFWRDHGFAETQPGQFALDLRAWTRPDNLPIRITIADGGDAASPTYTPTASHPAAPVTASL